MFTADSILTLSNDSAFKAESLVQKAELPLVAVKEQFVGFEGIPIQPFLFSENWLFGLMLFLFFLIAFSVWLNPSFFLDNLESAGGVKKQYFGSLKLRLVTAPFYLLVYLLLSSGTIALFAYLFIQKESMQLNFFVYLSFVGITMAYLVLKIFITRFLCYFFFDKKTFVVLVKMIYNLLLLLSFLLFPLLILAVFSSFFSLRLLFITGSVVFFLIALVALIRLFHVFYDKKLDFFYILLYLCTLEILPVLLIFQVYELIV